MTATRLSSKTTRLAEVTWHRADYVLMDGKEFPTENKLVDEISTRGGEDQQREVRFRIRPFSSVIAARHTIVCASADNMTRVLDALERCDERRLVGIVRTWISSEGLLCVSRRASSHALVFRP